MQSEDEDCATLARQHSVSIPWREVAEVAMSSTSFANATWQQENQS